MANSEKQEIVVLSGLAPFENTTAPEGSAVVTLNIQRWGSGKEEPITVAIPQENE